MAKKSKSEEVISSPELPALFDALEGELGRGGFNPDLAAVDDLLAAIHALPVSDEADKLRRKDQALVNTIGQLQNLVDGAGWMPQGTAQAFRLVVGALMQVEGVLWELKGEPGPPPQPQRRPTPTALTLGRLLLASAADDLRKKAEEEKEAHPGRDDEIDDVLRKLLSALDKYGNTPEGAELLKRYGGRQIEEAARPCNCTIGATVKGGGALATGVNEVPKVLWSTTGPLRIEASCMCPGCKKTSCSFGAFMTTGKFALPALAPGQNVVIVPTQRGGKVCDLIGFTVTAVCDGKPKCVRTFIIHLDK